MVFKTLHLKQSHKFSSGFTLIEFVISISVVSIIATIILWNYPSFRDRVALNSQAFEISLNIRQAQIYALGVVDSGVSGDSFDVGYGNRFSINSPTSFISFVDKDKNGKYDQSNNELIETISILNNNTITKICGSRSDGSKRCSNNPGGPISLDVSFLRPSPRATVKLFNSAGGQINSLSAPSTITLTSEEGDEQNIVIDKTGQIFVQ